MSKITTAINLLKHNRGEFFASILIHLNFLFPDKLYLTLLFRLKMGYWMDWENPKTFSEKLQWLKLYNRKPEYTKMVDKYGAKQYIAEHIGEEYVIPTLGVWDRFEDIDFDSLPDQFVLKCTHDSGGLVICRDKKTLDKQAAKKKIKASLKRNYYWQNREWPYKNVKPRIIAEAYMTDEPGTTEFTDYKFFCFGDYVDCVMCCYDRSTGHVQFCFFDENWTFKRYAYDDLELPEGFTKPKPANIDEMFDLAKKIASVVNAPFVRVDLYNSCGKIYFGELTFFPCSGVDTTFTPEADRYFGDLIQLKDI